MSSRLLSQQRSTTGKYLSLNISQRQVKQVIRPSVFTNMNVPLTGNEISHVKLRMNLVQLHLISLE